MWLAATAIPASAQEPETRAEADRQRREEKSRNTQPYEPRGLERATNLTENGALFVLNREGFYPKLGSLTTGSGFAYGGGYRDRDLLNHRHGGLPSFSALALIRRSSRSIHTLVSSGC
ncbi:MAG: hypothetical protein C5B57_08720 [Blastocatellia bacterium]|nr:MAG: hypothetical protein C5B57_08720 [Blastocatellia bacterium]